MNAWRGLLVLASALSWLCSANAASGSDSRLERVIAAKALRVCIWPEYQGITYRNPKTRVLSGIDIDMANEFAKDLRVRIQFVDSSFAAVTDDLLRDRCDLAMFAIGVTAQRAEKLRFTRPYLASDIYAIVSKSNRRIKAWEDIDKPGVVVAVAKGTLHEAAMREKLAQATLVVLDAPQGREQEVEAGRADVFMTDYPYSSHLLDTADWARLIPPPADYHVTSYAYAMAPGDDRWLARVERFVADIKRDGRLTRAASAHKLTPIVLKN